MWLQILTLACLGLRAEPGGSVAIQDTAAMRRAAEALLKDLANQRFGQDISVVVAAPDQRLRLAACTTNLQAFLPPSAKLAGATSVGIRCLRPKPWTVYLQARVTVWETVAVAARALPRAAIVGPEDIDMRKTDTSNLYGGYFRLGEEVIGMSVKRSVAPGVVLSTNMLARPLVVRRGETVTLLARAGNLEVRASARALVDGAVGDRIGVQNAASKKRLQGVVLGRGLVRVSNEL